jgi:hypothetical protein
VVDGEARKDRFVGEQGVLGRPSPLLLADVVADYRACVDRQMAELMVENWDRDEPDRAGELHVEPVELETSAN